MSNKSETSMRTRYDKETYENIEAIFLQMQALPIPTASITEGIYHSLFGIVGDKTIKRLMLSDDEIESNVRCAEKWLIEFKHPNQVKKFEQTCAVLSAPPPFIQRRREIISQFEELIAELKEELNNKVETKPLTRTPDKEFCHATALLAGIQSQQASSSAVIISQISATPLAVHAALEQSYEVALQQTQSRSAASVAVEEIKPLTGTNLNASAVSTATIEVKSEALTAEEIDELYAPVESVSEFKTEAVDEEADDELYAAEAHATTQEEINTASFRVEHALTMSGQIQQSFGGIRAKL